MLQQIARFFIGDFEAESIATELDLLAIIEQQRTEPKFGDTVVFTSKWDGMEFVCEFIEMNCATERTHVLMFNPFRKGGIWEELWVDSDTITLASKQTAVHIWRLYPQMWNDDALN